MRDLLLAIDQGTTSSRAILFRRDGEVLATHQQEFRQIFPDNGWVEHDPGEIWQTTLAVCRAALDGHEHKVAAIGVTNQRETTLVWDRATGEPVYNAIVWQDRRTAAAMQALRDAGEERDLSARTGLLLDPYFSASKLAWILDNVPGARARAEKGELAFGTVDSFLIYRLTGGARHVTDITNASRTNLYNIHECRWDDELLRLFDVPAAVLPEVLDCVGDFGTTGKGVFDTPLPIGGVAGDQQAATVGQACFEPGMIKSTYGTGCFALVNTGDKPLASTNRLLTTVAYRIGGQTRYALEGSIFIAGAAVQWLRDGLGVIGDAAETRALAAGLDSNRGVYLVPAFTGLGAPHWDPDARGALFGLTRETGPAELARAALEAAAYQTHDLFEAMRADGIAPAAVRVDGGMVRNDWLAQFIADILDLPVERPANFETTAAGAAWLAALSAGLYRDTAEIASHWRAERRFSPALGREARAGLVSGWRDAVRRTLSGGPAGRSGGAGG